MTTQIIGTGRYLPEKIVTNYDLAKVVDTSDEWIKERSGIRERRVVSDESTSFMAAKAACLALVDAGVEAQEIDLLIVATMSAEQSLPNMACEVQHRIGATDAICFDINAACTGFVSALNTVHAYIKAGIVKTALVIGAEAMSRVLDWKDRSTCILFGDGAGAVVVRAGEHGIIDCILHTDGSRGDCLTMKSRQGYLAMNGQEVFRFAVKSVPQVIEEILIKNKQTAADIDYFILHQANIRIIQSVAKRLSVSIDRFPSNLDSYGNTSAASIPILLDELNKKKCLKQKDKILITGFGAGLIWGSILLEW